jgi:glyoxylase-like metal-dependent hydrolase (beta-lactamase superfamily II)/rhodanese-related sulfurtransferase
VLDVHVLETPNLGDRSYVVSDGSTAVVVDPQRDIDRVLAVLDRQSLRLGAVAETHIHNDYVTGGLELARSAGVDYLVGADDDVAFDRTPVRDGDAVDVGGFRVRAIATPGHTFTHLSYAVERNGAVAAVFTGGSLLFGSTGRPDLMGNEHAGTLAQAQWRSIRRLADELPPGTPVYPTHGFGSFCSSTQSGGTESTIGRERTVNPALTQDEAQFVAETLAGLDVYPAYYVRMAPANAAGPPPVDLTPPPRVDDVGHRIEAGEWVIDVRPRAEFAAGHTLGTLSFDRAGNVATYLGWLLPWGTPVTIAGATPDDVAAVQRELVRIGIDRPAAMAVGGPHAWSNGRPRSSYRVATFDDMARERAQSVLDVRRTSEWLQSHVPHAVHVPLHELADRMDEVPDAEPLWVHCAGGFRAAIGASILDAAGRRVVHVDDEFERAAAAGVPIVRPTGR